MEPNILIPMPILDKPLHELQEYRGINPRPDDFDTFWDKSLKDLDNTKPNVEMTPVNVLGNTNAELFDLYFTGVGGARVYAKSPAQGRKKAGPGGGAIPWLQRQQRRLVGQIELRQRRLRRRRARLPRPGRPQRRQLAGHGKYSPGPHHSRARRSAGADAFSPNLPRYRATRAHRHGPARSRPHPRRRHGRIAGRRVDHRLRRAGAAHSPGRFRLPPPTTSACGKWTSPRMPTRT